MRSDPKLWEKSKLNALSKYSEDGRWNARIAQHAVRIYKDNGGTYLTPKPKNNSLTKWTKENWMYHPSDTNKTGRYLPEKVWKQLTTEQIKETNKNKRNGKNKFVPWEPFILKIKKNDF